jgi:hypothetical protein
MIMGYEPRSHEFGVMGILDPGFMTGAGQMYYVEENNLIDWYIENSEEYGDPEVRALEDAFNAPTVNHPKKWGNTRTITSMNNVLESVMYYLDNYNVEGTELNDNILGAIFALNKGDAQTAASHIRNLIQIFGELENQLTSAGGQVTSNSKESRQVINMEDRTQSSTKGYEHRFEDYKKELREKGKKQHHGEKESSVEMNRISMPDDHIIAAMTPEQLDRHLSAELLNQPSKTHGFNDQDQKEEEGQPKPGEGKPEGKEDKDKKSMYDELGLYRKPEPAKAMPADIPSQLQGPQKPKPTASTRFANEDPISERWRGDRPSVYKNEMAGYDLDSLEDIPDHTRWDMTPAGPATGERWMLTRSEADPAESFPHGPMTMR